MSTARERPTAETLKARYGLPTGVPEIERTYPLLFAVTHQGKPYTYAADTLGVLYVFCDPCAASKRPPRKPVGPIERLSESQGSVVRRGCGHLSYVPSLKEVRARAAGVDTQIRTFLKNRAGRAAAEAPRPRRRVVLGLAASAAAVAAAGVALFSWHREPPAPQPFREPERVGNLIRDAEASLRKGGAGSQRQVADAREAFRKIQEATPAMTHEMIVMKARLAKMEGKKPQR